MNIRKKVGETIPVLSVYSMQISSKINPPLPIDKTTTYQNRRVTTNSI
uniref:Uncharacterized protein n=1 Tax=Arundo donax TaxID=35708 RepID=A0A0A9CAW3_ARUDO